MAEFDKTFDCAADNYAGIIQTRTLIRGDVLHKVFRSLTSLHVVTEIRGLAIPPNIFRNTQELRVITDLRADVFVEYVKSNWVGWSKIGDITFKQDLTNDSGYKPMSWPGIVYSVLKLDKNAVIYGSGGVTLMNPVTDPVPTFGFKDLLGFGIKGKSCVCGNAKKHYFIDINGSLWMLSDKLQNLGYEEFLAPLVNPVMFYDEINDLVFISSADAGYVLSKDGLGGGYPSITGVQYVGNVRVFTSPGEIASPDPLEIVTDTLDFQYRGMKTIEYIQVGTDLSSGLLAAVDYRYDKNAEFQTSPFVHVNKEGVAFTKAAGVEFRLRVKAESFTPFEVDYITVSYKVTDKRYVRGRQGVLGYGD